MFADAWAPDLRRRLKYFARLMLTSRARARVLSACASDDFARALLRTRPRAFYPLMSHYLDRRFDVAQRLEATLASLSGLPAHLRDENRQRLLTEQGLPLLVLEGGSVLSLSLSGVSFHEGLWQLGLHSSARQRLYSIGFGFTAPGRLLVANVQGASLGIDGLESSRLMTQAAEGMRPPHLLMHALRSLAHCLDVVSLMGIDPSNHVKGRWNLRRSRLQYDYREFWKALGGVSDPSGNWSLPIQIEQRPIEDIATRRRAMYRRRYALLKCLDESILKLLPPADVQSAHAAT